MDLDNKYRILKDKKGKEKAEPLRIYKSYITERG